MASTGVDLSGDVQVFVTHLLIHRTRGVASPAGGPDEGVGGLRQGAGEGDWLRFVSGVSVPVLRACTVSCRAACMYSQSPPPCQ